MKFAVAYQRTVYALSISALKSTFVYNYQEQPDGRHFALVGAPTDFDRRRRCYRTTYANVKLTPMKQNRNQRNPLDNSA